jgi:hypothetical protein
MKDERLWWQRHNIEFFCFVWQQRRSVRALCLEKDGEGVAQSALGHVLKRFPDQEERGITGRGGGGRVGQGGNRVLAGAAEDSFKRDSKRQTQPVSGTREGDVAAGAARGGDGG